MTRHIITDKERGHRKPLSSTEKTVTYTVKMPESLRAACKKAGPDKVRSVLDKLLQ